MPMDHPDMESLVRVGKMIKCPPNDGESEDQYRTRLALAMEATGDRVWAMEIRSKKGWDKMDSGEALLDLFDQADRSRRNKV